MIPIQMTIKGSWQGLIKGSCDNEAIPVYYLAKGLESPSKRRNSGNVSGKDIQHKPLVIAKKLDVSSGKLMDAMVNRELIESIELKWFKTDQGGQDYNFFTDTISNAIITGYHMDNLTEFVSFTYEKINWKHEPSGVESEHDWQLITTSEGFPVFAGDYRKKEDSSLQLKIVNNKNSSPVQKIRLSINHPEGKIYYPVSDYSGTVHLKNIKKGPYFLNNKVNDKSIGPNLTNTLAFSGIGTNTCDKFDFDLPSDKDLEEAGCKRNFRYVVNIKEYNVQDGDTLKNIAESHKMSVQELVKFNWNTLDKKTINKAVRRDIGCSTQNDNGEHVFTEDDSPGVIFIPSALNITDIKTGYQVETIRVSEVNYFQYLKTITINIKDDNGSTLPFYKFDVLNPDGTTTTRETTENGNLSITGINAQKSVIILNGIHLPELLKIKENRQYVFHEDKTDAENPEKQTLKEIYTTTHGECLISVARKFGFINYESLIEFDHPENEKFLGEDYDITNTPEGTKIAIPEKEPAQFISNKGNVEIIIPVKRLWFSIDLKDPLKKNLAGIKFILLIYENGQVYEGNSDGVGRIEVEIPCDSVSGQLIIFPYSAPYDKPAVYKVKFQSLDPVEINKGQRSRYINSGVYTLTRNKDEALSDSIKTLMENPDRIVTPENFQAGCSSGLAEITAKRSELIREIEDIKKQIKGTNNEEKEYFTLCNEKIKKLADLKKVEEQAGVLEENASKLYDFFANNKIRVYSSHEYDSRINNKINALFTSALTDEISVTEKTTDILSRIIPIDNKHLRLFGGINTFESQLDKDNNQLSEFDEKLNSEEEISDANLRKHYIDLRGKTALRIKLLETQIEYTKNNEPPDEEIKSLDIWYNPENDLIKPNPYVSKSIFVNNADRPTNRMRRREIPDIILNEPPLKVYFEYDDKQGGIIRNSTIIYWAYDNGGTELDKTSVSPSVPIMYPVGIGMTSRAGRLIKTYSLSHMRDSFVNSIKDEKFTTDYMLQAAISCFSDVNTDAGNMLSLTFAEGSIGENLEETTKNMVKKGVFRKASMGYFNPNITYGFFVYPSYKDSFVTKSLLDLTAIKAFKEKTIAVKGKIGELAKESNTKNPNTIKLFCPLPEWERRILELTRELEQAKIKYNYAKEPHLKKLLTLSHMKDLVGKNRDYPYFKQADVTIENRGIIIDELTSLENEIVRKITEPSESDGGTGFFKHIDDIETLAESVAEMLSCEAFLAEVRNYFIHIIHLDKEEVKERISIGQLLPPGPYMTEEKWGSVFVTLGRAFSALAGTKQEERIGKTIADDIEKAEADESIKEYVFISEDDKPGFSHQEVRFRPGKECINDEAAYRLQMEDEDKYQPATINESKTLFSIIRKGFSDFMDTIEFIDSETETYKKFLGLLTSTPGPPCFMDVVYSVYSSHIMKKMEANKSASTAYLAIMVKSMGLFGQKNTVDFKKCKGILYKNLYTPNERKIGQMGGAGFKSLFYPLEIPDEVYETTHTNVSKFYRTCFTFLSVGSVIVDLRHNRKKMDEPEDLQMMRSIKTWGDTFYAGISGYLLIRVLRSRPTEGLKITKAGGALGIASTGLNAIICWHEAYNIYEKGLTDSNIDKFYDKLATGAGDGALAIGSLIVSTSLRFAGRELALSRLGLVPFAGQAMVVGGTIVNVYLFAKEIVKIAYDYFNQPIGTAIYGPVGWEISALWEKFSSYDQLPEHCKAKDYCDLQEIDAYRIYKKHWNMTTAIKKIESLHLTVLKQYGGEKEGAGFIQSMADLLVDSGINWSLFGWHAVIPLYVQGYSVEQIKRLVVVQKVYFLVDDEGNRLYVTEKFIDSVEEIIEYYDFCMKSSEIVNNEFEISEGAGKTLLAHDITRQLEEGKFLPYAFIKDGYKFYQSEKWNIDHFGEKANKEGVMDLGAEVANLESAKLAVDWQKMVTQKEGLLNKTIGICYIATKAYLKRNTVDLLYDGKESVVNREASEEKWRLYYEMIKNDQEKLKVLK